MWSQICVQSLLNSWDLLRSSKIQLPLASHAAPSSEDSDARFFGNLVVVLVEQTPKMRKILASDHGYHGHHQKSWMRTYICTTVQLCSGLSLFEELWVIVENHLALENSEAEIASTPLPRTSSTHFQRFQRMTAVLGFPPGTYLAGCIKLSHLG